MKVDLHCHTTISDGSYSFDEIIDLAEKEEIGYLAITNHDTTKGLVEVMEKAKNRKVKIIPGIEISAYDFNRKTRVHVLGYFIEPGHSALDKLCQQIVERRHQASYEMVRRLVEAGYRIRWEEVELQAAGGTGVYKQHIMHALLEQGYTQSIYGDLYKKLFSRDQNGISPGIAFVPIEYVEAKLAVEAILQAGGVPVLAHPGQYHNFEAVPELVQFGLVGIEVWHPLHTLEDEEKAIQLANEYDLVKTGGTDFHGFYGEKSIALGSIGPDLKCISELKAKK